MTEFRKVAPDFYIAAQLTSADVVRAAAAGFKTILNNRPDGEAPDQPKEAEIKAAAEAAGMSYTAVQFTGPPPPGAVAAMVGVLEGTPTPVLAYCRSGRRSIMAWAMAQALAGARRPDEIIALAAKAGYDLEGARGALDTLAPRS